MRLEARRDNLLRNIEAGSEEELEDEIMRIQAGYEDASEAACDERRGN